MIAECIRHFEYSRTSLNLMVVINILYVVVILFSTHNLPGLKGFGYGSFLATIAVCSCFEKSINAVIRLYNRIKSKDQDSAVSAHKETEKVLNNWYSGLFVYTPIALILVLFFFRLSSNSFNAQLGARENAVFDAMYIANLNGRANPAVLDCDQDYLLQFEWGRKCEKHDVNGADCVILDRNMVIPGYNGDDAFKFYQDYKTIDFEYLDTMHIEYENEHFIIYTK